MGAHAPVPQSLRHNLAQDCSADTWRCPRPANKPVSTQRSHTEALEGVSPGSAVFLAKNARGRHAILDTAGHDRLFSEQALFFEPQRAHVR